MSFLRILEDTKMQNTVKYVTAVLIMFSVTCLLTACTGNTGTGDAPEDFAGTTYIPGDSTGSISLSIDTGPNNRVPTGDVISFLVRVFNSDGGPVAQAPVICGAEGDDVIFDPDRGLTDRFGTFSGLLACTEPGSRQLLCEVQGTTKRQWASIVCIGELQD